MTTKQPNINMRTAYHAQGSESVVFFSFSGSAAASLLLAKGNINGTRRVQGNEQVLLVLLKKMQALF